MLKKVIVSVSLALVLVIGVVGGTVLAATPPDNSPKGTWSIIAEGVEDILAELGLIETDLDDIDTKVDALAGDVTNVMGELENVARIESAQGVLKSTANESDVFIYESSLFSQGAHFQVTIQAQNVTAFETIRVIRGWSSSGHSYSTATSYHAPGFYNIEFDAHRCAISYISKTDDGDPLLQFGWGVTTTHAP
jgi:hypothetical protein